MTLVNDAAVLAHDLQNPAGNILDREVSGKDDDDEEEDNNDEPDDNDDDNDVEPENADDQSSKSPTYVKVDRVRVSKKNPRHGYVVGAMKGVEKMGKFGYIVRFNR